MEWFSWLKIYCTIFYLHHNVISEFSIEWNKFVVGLLMPVIRNFIAVNKCTPYNYSIVRGHCIGKHVGAISMIATIILRTRLSFGICFDKKTAEVRNQFINFSCFICP